MRNKKILGLLLAGVMVTSIPFNVFADDAAEVAEQKAGDSNVAVVQAGPTAGETDSTEKENEENVAKEDKKEEEKESKKDPEENKDNKEADKKEGEGSVEDKEEPKVTFDSKGGQGTVEVTKDNDGNILEPNAPTKEGYSFLGWYEGDTKVTFPYKVEKKVTLVAHWQAKEFNVKFNSNGGTAIADKKVVYNNAVEKPDDPDKTGYKFKGWYTESEFKNEFKFDTKITKNTTLYAKWEKIEEDKPAVPTKEDLYISDIEYDGNYVTGKVTSKGEPVYKATVTLKIDGSKTTYDDETDSNGRFKVYLGKYYDDYRYYYDDDYYYRDGYRYYDGYRVYSDSDGWYYYKNGRKRYINYDYGYRRYRDYKADLVAEKSGFYSAEKNLWKDGYYYNNGRYYGRDWYYGKYDHRVYPTDISRTNYSTSGYLKGYKNRTVYVYDDGTYLGSDTIDSDGYFKVSWNSPRVSTSRSLEYYVNGTYKSDSSYSMIPVVNDLAAGAKFVRGNAGAYADVTVYDSNGTRLGGATAGSTGIFNISLNRELRAGETIKVEAKESGKTSRSTEVKIAGQEAKVAAKVNSPSYIAGYPDGTFKPGKEVTRAEAVRMFVQLVNEGKELPKNPTTKFKDANNKWYSDEINFAVSKGFISGYSDGTFKPNQGITRAEFAQMIAVFVKDGYPGSSNFKDVKGHWASNAIDQLYGNKKIKGFPDGTFKPDQKLTRAEAVTVLNSVFGRNTKSTSFANVNTNSLKKFSDVPMSHWAYYQIIDASNGHNAVKGDKAEDVSVWQ
ncbi:S-layer homology domain-containing protein [uncultured Peptoniphilus sp.]|uniref:S-layer homology domain-containing protein n=1 Tax=uncultured Peptoniphilus sp. TaxID=254354 RepID=UPI0025ED877F|nr:S-layer homology domain-containing protein [uncultured Peptoniphilus sp.]